MEDAQKQFFKEQKKVLECEELDDQMFEKSLEISSRLLTEYILYRSLIIKKLKEMTPANSEAEIHNFIVPKYKTLDSSNFSEDIYHNNVWLLDDKYMSYTTILSEAKMDKVVKAIALDGEDVDNDDKRPDITLVFSGNPESCDKVDVIVVELKKKGLGLAKNEEVVSQLKQRARKLLKYFPDKIERIWFYGITDIDSEFRMALKDEDYIELFAHGQMFYKPQKIHLDESNHILADLYVLSYDTLIDDAETRNKTFLEVLKSGIKGLKG